MQELVNYLESWLKERKVDTSGNKVNALHIFHLLNSKNGTRILECLETTHTDKTDVNPLVFDPTALKSRGLTCLTCGLTFEDIINQQQHFKTSAHRQNLIRKLHGLTPQLVSDESLDADLLAKKLSTTSTLVDEPPSDEEDGDSHSDKDDEPEAPNASSVAENAKFSNEFGTVRKSFSRTYGPLLHFRFRSSSIGESSPSPSSLLKLECCIPTAICRQDSGLNRIQFFESGINPFALLQSHLQQLRHNSMITVLMLRSGRFAGAVFDYDASKGLSHMLVHKVFRRYTVRAKAGGGQSSHDNKGGKARSAGAMLRRYGEQALKDDVGTTLQLWSGHIESSGVILIAAPKTMRPSLFDSAGTVLDKEDSRISYVPFPVDKPTLESLQVIHSRCTSILFTSVIDKAVVAEVGNNHVDAGDEGRSETEAAVSMAIESANVVEHLDVHRDEEEDLLMKSPISESLIAACLAENEAEILRILDDPTHTAEELKVALSIPDSLAEMNTPLHIASSKGLLKAVYALLVKGASPCQLDVRGRPSYFLAKDKDTRDVFRRYRGAVEEQEQDEEAEADAAELAEGEKSPKKVALCNWDWTAAGVGPALTESIERSQRQKEKEKKKRAAQRKKEQKVQDERAAAAAALQLAQQQKEEEERREKQKMDAGKCAACGQLLFGSIPIQVLGEKCCSSACVLKVRRSLAAEAALKRLDRMN